MKYSDATQIIGGQIIRELNDSVDSQVSKLIYEKNFEGDLKMKELLSFLLEYGIWNFYSYLIGLRDFLSELNYSDLLEILVHFIHHKKNPALRKLENFLESVYVFLGIDLITEFARYEGINKEERKEVLEFYYTRPGFLCREILNDELISQGLNFDIFTLIQEKMILQGGVKAEIVNSKPHIDMKYGIEIFSVQGTPPKSWNWMNEFE